MVKFFLGVVGILAVALTEMFHVVGKRVEPDQAVELVRLVGRVVVEDHSVVNALDCSVVVN